MKIISNLLALVLGLTIASIAQAADLDEILERGKIVIGVQNDVPPYSSVGDENQPVGYDIDVARLVAERLGVDLEMVVLTGANRVPYILSERVDAVIATIGITPERKEVIAFTRPYLVFQTVVLAPKDLEISSVEETGGHRIGVTRGTMMDPLITNAAPEDAMIVRFDDDATTAVALATGQVDMVPTGELIARAIAQQNPDRDLEIKFVMASTYAGIGLNKDNPELLERLNSVLGESLQDGSLAAIYEEWLGSELPSLPETAG